MTFVALIAVPKRTKSNEMLYSNHRITQVDNWREATNEGICLALRLSGALVSLTVEQCCRRGHGHSGNCL